MKIAFLCGSLEPGRDGVGDYTRTLAKELIKKGCDVRLLSINDSHTATRVTGVQTVDFVEIPIIRLPSSLDVSTKTRVAQSWIDNFNPDYLSLQFVIFSFHPKGLPFGLVKQLSAIGAGRKWHIMFHELWVGMSRVDSYKLKLWGSIQKTIITKLIKKLKPRVIHTQNHLYQHMLQKLGCKTEVLPLFSNIPYAKVGLLDQFKERIVPVIVLAVFGTIHPGALIEDFAKEAELYAAKNKVTIVMQFIGRCGQEQNRWIEVWKSPHLETKIFGELPVHQISEILQKSSIGISSTPLTLIEKSGSVAAMVEHCLPIVSIAPECVLSHINGANTPVNVTAYKKGNFAECMNNKIDIKSGNRKEKAAEQLLASLI